MFYAKGKLRLAAWSGVLLLIEASVLRGVQNDWVSVAVLAGFCLVTVAFLIMNKRLPALVELFIVGAALFNASGYVWNLYDTLAPFDKLVHGYTLFALTLPLGLLARGPLLHGERNYRLWFILVVASFGVTLGALWEVAEWAFDLIASGNVIQGKSDTITDIIVDTVGALLAGWLSCWVLCRQEQVE